MFIKGSISQQTVLGLLRGLNLVGLSGALTLVRRAGQAVLILRRGRLVHIATSTSRETVGSALVLSGVITSQQLQEALAAQFEGQEPRRLATLLVEQGIAEREAVVRILKRHVLDQLEDVLGWEDGVYRFEQLYLVEEDSISFPLAALLRELDTPSTTELESFAASEREINADLMAVFGEAPESTHEMRARTLPQMIHQVHNFTFEAELILQLLDYTSQFVDRGVLVQCREDRFHGLAQFGLDSKNGPPNERIRKLVLPSDQPSVFRDVRESGTAALGPLQPTECNSQFIELLDGRVPTCAVALPFKIGNEVAMIVYGDMITDRPIEAIELLESVISQASLALEKSTLEARVRQLEVELQRASREYRSATRDLTGAPRPDEPDSPDSPDSP